MNAHLYERYLLLKQQGKRDEAHRALKEFCLSVESDQEKHQWVRDYLEHHDSSQKMPHPLFVHLVLPVLLAGFAKRDAWSALWLGRLNENLLAGPDIPPNAREKSALEYLWQAHEWEPSEQTRQALLGVYLRWFEDCQHEWPSGILYGCDGANLSECNDILCDIGLARSLDTSSEHGLFLSNFEQKVLQYRERLQGIDEG